MELKTYEFHVYGADEDGNVPMDPREVVRLPCFDVTSAKRAAKKLAKQFTGPVDCAVAGPSPWPDRYVGTASPGLFGTGIVFERLD